MALVFERLWSRAISRNVRFSFIAFYAARCRAYLECGGLTPLWIAAERRESPQFLLAQRDSKAQQGLRTPKIGNADPPDSVS